MTFSETSSTSLSRSILSDDPDQMIRYNLQKDLDRSGSTWLVADRPQDFQGIEGVHLAESEGKVYVSTNTGLAEFHLSEWLAARAGGFVSSLHCDDAALLDHQRCAGLVCLGSKIAILSGLPGSGKTYTARSIVESLQRARVLTKGCAFTGRAAKRLSESTGLESFTLHRLLGHNGKGFTVRELDAECVIVDETQLLTPGYLLALGSRMRQDARLILIGDPDQLTMSGRLLADLIDSGRIPHAHLKEVVRQEADSPIGHAAACVLAGRMPEEEKSPSSIGGVFLRQCESLSVESRKKRTPNHPMTIAEGMARLDCSELREVRTMCHTNKTKNLLNGQFNKYRANPLERVPVIQLKNRHSEELYNGDIGYLDVRCINTGDGKTHLLKGSEGGEWEHAWSTTTHKVIGSEARSVQVVLEESMTRNVLYTAITRGKVRVAINGPQKTLARICRRKEVEKVTLLSKFMTGQARIIES